MGCGQTKHVRDKDKQQEPEVRKVLSVSGDVGPGSSPEECSNGTDDDTGLLLMLGREQVLQLVNKPAIGDDKLAMGRSFSITSQTDEKMNKVPSGTGKTISQAGAATSEKGPLGIGYVCKKGLKPESPNQDSFFILQVESDYSIYGVFDGHGKKGHDVSNFVKECLPKLLLMDPNLSNDPLTALANAFDKTQQLIVKSTDLKHIDASRSGTTCSVIFYDHRQNTLHIAHVGDSRCVLGRSGTPPGVQPSTEATTAAAKRGWEAVDLTVDHKPDNPEEKARIEAAGGKVVYDGYRNYRVYAKDRKGPGLNMSRAMGDLTGYFHAGISCVPDISSHNVASRSGAAAGTAKDDAGDDAACRVATSESLTSSASLTSYRVQLMDKFVLLCSDGVWEFLSSRDAVNVISQFPRPEAMGAAERLSEVAWDLWIREMEGQVVDDITVLLIHLLEPEGRAAEGQSTPADSAGGGQITVSRTSEDYFGT